MKKILIIILCLFIVSGCNKENKTNTNKQEKKIISKSNSNRKEYYVSSVNYVNHDDYLKEETSRKATIYSSNKKLSNEKVECNKDLCDDAVMKKEEGENKNDIDIKTNTVLKSEDESIKENEEIIDKEESEDIKENEEIIDKEESKDIKENDEKEIISNSNIISESDNKEDITNLEDIPKGDVIKEDIDETIEKGNDIVEVKDILEDKKVGYYSATGKYLGESKVKVVDVSYYQGNINWDLFASESDCYGVILRLGYYDTLDKKFETNIKELKRLNIPYGIYLFSYSTTINGSNKEANFTNKMIDKYDLKPSLGIYYDIESWNASNGASSNEISKNMYDKIIINYINKVSKHINNQYKVKVYSGRWYAQNKLGSISKSYVDWVAEYNSTCKYDGIYSMWQYTSKGSVPGINGDVDISYLY